MVNPAYRNAPPQNSRRRSFIRSAIAQATECAAGLNDPCRGSVRAVLKRVLESHGLRIIRHTGCWVAVSTVLGGCMITGAEQAQLNPQPFIEQSYASPYQKHATETEAHQIGAGMDFRHSAATATTVGERTLRTTSGTIIDSTSCTVPVDHAPAFQRDGLPYRQDINARGMVRYEIPPLPPAPTVDVTALLNQHLRNIATTPDEYRTHTRMMTRQPSFQFTNVHHAYARGATGAGIRIAIDDTPIDILSTELRGRIQYDGATLLLRQPYAHDSDLYSNPELVLSLNSPTQQRPAFSHCVTPSTASTAQNDCSVWEINAGGDERLINEYGRYIIAQFGYPDKENSWWIRDTSESTNYAWYEIPALFDPVPYRSPDGELFESYVPQNGYQHGTNVATVAAGWNYGIAPGSHIVPIARDLVDQWDRFYNNHYFRIDNVWTEIRTGEWSAEQMASTDQYQANRQSEQYSKFDIINFSHSDDVLPNLRAETENSGPFLYERNVRDYFPRWWRALQQLDIPATMRVIEVHAAGNQGGNSQLKIRPLGDAARAYRFAGFRGHNLAVVAVDESGEIADYSNWCGEVPDRESADAAWDVNTHGRHYCLAAPGNVNAVNTGTRTNDTPPARRVTGTSFAAPVVAGSLALLMQFFTSPTGERQLGNTEIVLRLVNTANNRGHEYSQSHIYGAGLIDLDAATAPVGSTNMGNAEVFAPTSTSIAVLPRAYGDVRTRLRHVPIATFDTWNAPFFVTGGDFLHQSSFGVSELIPQLAGDQAPSTHLTTTALGLVRSPAPMVDHGLSLLAHGTGVGAAWITNQGIEFGAFADTASDQGAAVHGAFGEQVRSGMLWTELNYEFRFSESWQGWVTASVGAGKPDYDNSMLELGGSWYSAWSMELQANRFRLSLTQPWRAESGTGTLRFTSGRRMTGEHIYDAHQFSLEPDGREISLQAQYTWAAGLGQITMQVSGHRDYGHVRSETEARIGATYGWQW